MKITTLKLGMEREMLNTNVDDITQAYNYAMATVELPNYRDMINTEGKNYQIYQVYGSTKIKKKTVDILHKYKVLLETHNQKVISRYLRSRKCGIKPQSLSNNTVFVLNKIEYRKEGHGEVIKEYVKEWIDIKDLDIIVPFIWDNLYKTMYRVTPDVPEIGAKISKEGDINVLMKETITYLSYFEDELVENNCVMEFASIIDYRIFMARTQKPPRFISQKHDILIKYI